MQITVVFEHWHLGDGNYHAFVAGIGPRVVETQRPQYWREMGLDGMGRR
jgi:hypothetical protein